MKRELMMNGFYKTGEEIDTKQVEYWKSIIQKNLKIGVELESEFDRNKSLQEIAQNMAETLNPSDSMYNFGDNGVQTITSDESLMHGLEIPLVGRRVHFWSNLSQAEKVINEMKKHGAYIHQRAGTHNHMLLSYNRHTNEMEIPMPGIIFKNFMQLIRRFASELVWLTSTVKSGDSITRMDGFRRHDVMMSTTPTIEGRTVEQFIDRLRSRSYPFVRMAGMQARGNEITRFHCELRFPDCTLNPSQVAAQQVLFMAMLLKAVEFSKYGIVNAAGNDQLWNQQKAILNAICNRGQDRLSTPINDDLKVELAERAKTMVLYFTNTIKQVDDNALEVLKKLAEKPVSIRRQENDDLDKIEKQLIPKDARDNENNEAIAEVIDSMQILGCTSKKEWEEQLAEKLGVTYKVANNRVWKLSHSRKIDFDKDLGAVIFV